MSFEIKGLDDYTANMMRVLEDEYPKMVEKFIEKELNRCLNEVKERTPEGKKAKSKSKKLKEGWKVEIKKRKDNGRCYGRLKNARPHAHLIENGHITKNGGFVPGVHMLENTMTHQQPKIDRNIESLVDEVFNKIK